MTAAALPRPVLGPPPPPRVPPAERRRLPNGVRLVTALGGGTPHLALRLVLPAGSAADPCGGAGTASLVGSLLLEGTARTDAAELHRRLDALGASLDVQVGHDFAEVRALFLSDTVADGIALLAEAVTSPAFPAAEVERVRGETLDALAGRDDEPANVADDRLAAALFGAEHPYGLRVWGTSGTLAAIPRAALVRFHAERFRPDGAVLMAAGDAGGADLHALLADAIAGWRGRAAPVAVPPPFAPAGATVHLAWPDAAQAEIRLAAPGLPRRSAEWIPAVVANHILGGSTITGRLGANLREARGWTYGVRSGFAAGVGPGGWIAEMATDVATARAAVAEMRREVERMARERVAPAELRRAKDALILSLPGAFATPLRVASRFTTQEAYDLPEDYWTRFRSAVERVNADDVLRIARTQWPAAGLTEVTVGGPGADG